MAMNFQMTLQGMNWFELFFKKKMVKLDEKGSLDPKLNEFEWFGEVCKIIMFNMFVQFCHSLTISEVNS